MDGVAGRAWRKLASPAGRKDAPGTRRLEDQARGTLVRGVRRTGARAGGAAQRLVVALRRLALSLSPRRRARAGTWWMDVSLGECFRPSRWEGRLVGLLGTREEAAPALVLAPCSSIHTIGMRYPIDVAFVGPDGRALRTCVGVPPGRVVSCRGSHWVLERPHRGGWWFEEGEAVPAGPAGEGHA